MHRCPKCQTVNGPVMMGFRPGPIVDGAPTPIPQTVCLGCKVEVEEDASVPPPVGGYGFRDPPRVASPKGPSQTWSFGTGETFNVVKAARERLRALKQNLKLAAEWKREHDELERLLKAAKGDRKAIVRSIRSTG